MIESMARLEIVLLNAPRFIRQTWDVERAMLGLQRKLWELDHDTIALPGGAGAREGAADARRGLT